MAAVVTFVLLHCKSVQKYFDIDAAQAPALAMNIVIVAGIVIAAITGEKIIMNGNGKAPEAAPLNLDVIKDEVLTVVKEEVLKDLAADGQIDVKALKKTLLDSVSKRVINSIGKRMTKLEKDTDETLKKLEGSL